MALALARSAETASKIPGEGGGNRVTLPVTQLPMPKLSLCVMPGVNSVIIAYPIQRYALRWSRAYCVHLPYDFLTEVANRIINEMEGIARAAYAISSKPPTTIE